MGEVRGLASLEPLYTADEIASVLRLSSATVLRRMRAGEIESFKVGRGRRVKKSVFNAYLDSIGFGVPFADSSDTATTAGAA